MTDDTHVSHSSHPVERHLGNESDDETHSTSHAATSKHTWSEALELEASAGLLLLGLLLLAPLALLLLDDVRDVLGRVGRLLRRGEGEG